MVVELFKREGEKVVDGDVRERRTEGEEKERGEEEEKGERA